MNTVKDLFHLMCEPDCNVPFLNNVQILDLAEYLAKNCVVKLPCKVGDIVYKVEGHYITETEVERIIVDKGGFKLKLGCNAYYETRATSIGKTLFLTEEEAKAAARKEG